MRTLQREICLEEVISRIPGLFAYIESDDNGNTVLHHSYDAVDGCYGKIVADIKIPQNCGLYTYTKVQYDENITYKTCVHLPNVAKYNDSEYIKVNKYVDGAQTTPEYFDYYKRTTLLEGEKTYSYSTIIRYYYQYKKNESHPFISFINKGIGKEKTPEKYTQNKEHYLVPEVIYLSQVKDLYEQYNALSLLCKASACSSTKDFETCCKCQKYERMGGDEFKDYIKTLIDKAKKISNEMFNHANGTPCMTFGLSLSSSIDDLGYMSSYIKDFVPGECVYDGELVSYDGRTYVCVLNRDINPTIDGSFITWINDNFSLVKTFDGKVFEFDPYNGTYSQAQEPYNGTVVDCTRGYYNPDSMRYEFDSIHFVLVSEYSKTHYYDNSDDSDDYVYTEGIYCDKNTKGYKYYLDTDRDDNIDDSYTVSGQADSKLKSLRRFASFINDAGFVETPPEGEDWLFYYRKGYVTNTSVEHDEYGNIKTLDNTAPPDYGGYFTNLIAYGDVITDITRNPDNRTITFTYVLGAHLIAKRINPNQQQPEISSDGTQLYYYDLFEYDENMPNEGVTYTETYEYNRIDENYNYNSDSGDDSSGSDDDGGEIDLMTDQAFNNYITTFSHQLSQYRYAFHPISTSYGNISIQGDTHTFQYISTNFNATIQNELDMEYNPLFHNENYVNSIFEPKIDSDVNILRGNGASFERHFKLGEVKTVTAMAEYANGGFFRILES